MSYFHIYLHYKADVEAEIGYPNDVNYSFERAKDIVKKYENGEDFLLHGVTIRSSSSFIKKIEIFKTQSMVPTPPDWNQIGRIAELVTKEFTILPPGARGPGAILDKLMLHPIVRKSSEELFKDGHYAQAIFEAYKALNNYVKAKSQREDLDGKDLMAQVFSFKHDLATNEMQRKPLLQLNQLRTRSDRNEQEGFMFLFMGAIVGIRNPKGHDQIVQKDLFRTLEYLSFASLLTKRIDEAKVNC